MGLKLKLLGGPNEGL